jgi:hypothetical protein
MNTLIRLRITTVCASACLASSAAAVSPREIQPDKELLITHPAIVDSELARYPGPWSFGTLMAEMAGDDGRQFVKAWLDTMALPQKVQEQGAMLPQGLCVAGPIVEVHPRPNFQKLIVEPWQRRDGHVAETSGPWLPKLENAPFRLLAIVNRMDLGAASFVDFSGDEQAKWRLFGKEQEFRKLVASSKDGIPFGLQPETERFTPVNAGGGGWAGGGGETTGPNVGEGRLVFGAVSESGSPLPGGWTIIFEYKLGRPPGFENVVDRIANAGRDQGIARRELRGGTPLFWAREWHALGDLDLTDQRFATALENITRTFTHRAGGKAPRLGQLRSNDGACGPGREFRQYELKGATLSLATLPGTPAPAFMDRNSSEARALASFLREQTPLIRAGIGNLPSTLSDRGKTHRLDSLVAYIPEGRPGFHWDLAAPRETRRLFSLATCNGCHAGETGTLTGMHIQPRNIGEAARLSDWLGAGRNGLRVDDPNFKSTRVDLREMQDRREILAAFLNSRESSRMRELREVLRERLNRTH